MQQRTKSRSAIAGFHPPFSIFRSWKSDCWEGDLHRALEVYSEEELVAIADHGYTGIWLHQRLSDYTPSTLLSPLGSESEQHLATLSTLIDRAAKYHLKVYLYLLEPRALLVDDPFWLAYPELRGQFWKQPIYEREYYALCSEHPTVQAWLHDSLSRLTRQLRGLGGFIAITAAEDFSTCVGKLWAEDHFRKALPGMAISAMELEVNCPRCCSNKASDVISRLLNALNTAIREGNPSCQLLAWDWGWDHLPEDDPEGKIADKLSPDIIRLSDFEIGGSREIMGRTCAVQEYSLSYSGPSPRFQRQHRHAKDQNAPIAAKLQVGTTHELATIPNLPLIHSLYRKLDWIKQHDLQGVLATWNMGNMRTLNTYAFGQALQSSAPFSPELFYNKIIGTYLHLPPPSIARLKLAWSAFERAFETYPYSTPFIYRGPLNYAPAYWLPPQPVRGIATSMSCDVQVHGDDLSQALGSFSLKEVIEGFESLIEHWREGADLYCELLSDQSHPHFIEEENTVRCALLVFVSALHIFKLYQLCTDWEEAKCREPYLELCREELLNLRQLLPLLQSDSRLGFHCEAQTYLFNPELVSRKIDLLENTLTPAPVTP